MSSSSIEADSSLFVRQSNLQTIQDIPQVKSAQATSSEFEREQQTQEDRKEEQDRLEWKLWLEFENYDEDDEVARLETECKNLAEVWKGFHSRFPDLGSSDLANNELPSIKSVKLAVEGVVTQWEEKKAKGLGKAKNYLTSYCDTLLAHSELFSIFPQGDKYICLFTGVLSSVVKALARHDEIAEGFSRALMEISDNMKFTQRQSLVYPTSRMKTLVILLYVKYFQFLCHTMNWFSSKTKRFKASLNQSFHTKEVLEKTKEIRDIVAKIQQEATLQTQRTIEATHGHVVNLVTSDQMESQAEDMMEFISRRFQIADQNRDLSDKQLHSQLQLLTLKLGEVAQKAAAAAVEKLLYERESPIPPGTSELLDNPPGLPLLTQSSPKSSPPVYRRQGLEHESRHLEKFFETDGYTVERQTTCTTANMIPGEIVSRLQQFISATNSQQLWIMGRPLSSSGSEESRAAAHIVTLADRAEIPCISFFCGQQSSNRDRYVGVSTRETLLISLLYSVARQAILLVPESFEDAFDYQTTLKQLDGTPETITAALDMIRRSLRLAPRLLFCVLEGLHALDHPNVNSHIDELLNILQWPSNRQVVKTLIVTSGFISCGARFDAAARLDCSRTPRRKPGRGRPGAKSLLSLNFP